MPFEHRVTVRFYEIDRAGILFFGRVFEYAHAAFEELLCAVFEVEPAGLDGAFGRSPWAAPLVHAEADFKAPMRMGEHLIVRPRVERVGRRSFTIRSDIDGADGVPRAVVRLVHATIDRADFTPRDVPADLIDGFRRAGVLGEPGDGATS